MQAVGRTCGRGQTMRIPVCCVTAVLALALPLGFASVAHSQTPAFRDLDTLNQIFERRTQGSSPGSDAVDILAGQVLAGIARQAFLENCLDRARSARQIDVGPFRYYRPQRYRMGNSALPIGVQTFVLEDDDVLIVEGRCIRSFRVTGIAEGSPLLKQKLRIGDRIFAMDGHVFATSNDFLDYTVNQVVGTDATIGILTAGSRRPNIIVVPYEDRKRIERLNASRR